MFRYPMCQGCRMYVYVYYCYCSTLLFPAWYYLMMMIVAAVIVQPNLLLHVLYSSLLMRRHPFLLSVLYRIDCTINLFAYTAQVSNKLFYDGSMQQNNESINAIAVSNGSVPHKSCARCSMTSRCACILLAQLDISELHCLFCCFSTSSATSFEWPSMTDLRGGSHFSLPKVLIPT